MVVRTGALKHELSFHTKISTIKQKNIAKKCSRVGRSQEMSLHGTQELETWKKQRRLKLYFFVLFCLYIHLFFVNTTSLPSSLALAVILLKKITTLFTVTKILEISVKCMLFFECEEFDLGKNSN